MRVKWQLCHRPLPSPVRRLFAGSGAHSISDESETQVAFRNINVAANHASLDFNISAKHYGRTLLDVKRDMWSTGCLGNTLNPVD